MALLPLRTCFLVVFLQQWLKPGTGLMSLLLTGGGCSTSLGGRVRQTGSAAALIRIPVIPGTQRTGVWFRHLIAAASLLPMPWFLPASAGWTGLDPFRFFTGTVGTLRRKKNTPVSLQLSLHPLRQRLRETHWQRRMTVIPNINNRLNTEAEPSPHRTNRTKRLFLLLWLGGLPELFIRANPAGFHLLTDGRHSGDYPLRHRAVIILRQLTQLMGTLWSLLYSSCLSPFPPSDHFLDHSLTTLWCQPL